MMQYQGDSDKLTVAQRCRLRKRGFDIPLRHRCWRSSVAERFEEFYIPEPNSGCWLWTGWADKNGYGRLEFEGKRQRAHRIAWEIFKGPVPEGLYVLHRCDVPACVNPEHLFLGTNDDNTADMVEKERQARGERHYKAKLTADQVLAIRGDSRSQTSIAADYDISQAQVSAIQLRKTWAHLPEETP
jgi:hypothetical protein